MAETATPTLNTSKSKRAWNRHSFYMSDQMATVANWIAKKEEKRTGRQVGSGQVIDRAMRRYVAELLTPEELADVVNTKSGHAAD